MAKYITPKEIREAIGKTKVSQERATIQKLASLGYNAIMYAYNLGHGSGSAVGTPIKDGKWRHRTRNLHDSFGSAVYYNGHLIETSIRYVGGELSTKPDPLTKKTGRQTLNEFFHDSHYGKAKGEMVLVCVAAMHYVKYLEDGTHRGKYHIQVISAARDYIQQNYSRYFSDKNKTIVLRGIRPISNERDGLL